jgi:hypothetical protein
VHSYDPRKIFPGSLLVLDTIIYPPAPPSRRWVNVADTDDFIAAEPDLAALFSAGIPEGATFEGGGYTVDNGAQPHCGTFYLGKV